MECISQLACKPGSVHFGGPKAMTIPLGRPLLDASLRPTRTLSPENRLARLAPSTVFLLGLAPGGVYLATAVAGSAVGSYPTFSPFPRKEEVCFLLHFPWGLPRRALPGTVFPWSPDFPPLTIFRRCKGRPSGQLASLFGLELGGGQRNSWRRQPRMRGPFQIRRLWFAA